MPVYKSGDLVRLKDLEDNPDAIGIILEMRSMLNMQPEARILWNDLPGVDPRWLRLVDVEPLEVTP